MKRIDWITIATLFSLMLTLPATAMAMGGNAQVGGMGPHDAFSPATAELVDALIDEDSNRADLALHAGANTNEMGREEISPLFFVATIDLRQHTLERTEYLLQHQADPNYRTSTKVSVLSIAAQGVNVDLLRLLLKYHGNPNLIGNGGNTLLQLAAMAGRKENLAVLIEAGADVNLTTVPGGDTAGDIAAHLAHYDLLNFLLDHGLQATPHLARSVGRRRLPPGSDVEKLRGQLADRLRSQGLQVTINSK